MSGAIRLRAVFLVAALILAGAETTPGAAQNVYGRIPERPRLGAEQDTNSALAYYFYGSSALERSPAKAADAFYWAARLDPAWAAPIYGQYAALLLMQPPGELDAFLFRRERALRNPTLRRIDSLAYFAILKNPFVDRRLDGTILSTWVFRASGGEATLRDLNMRDRGMAGWAAYARNQFALAVDIYADAIKRHPEQPSLQYWRALSFIAMGKEDSALTAVQGALAVHRGAEKPLYEYVSHAFLEYSVGYLLERAGQRDSARAAYERSLLDDVAFHPAHHKLARMRQAAHDTAGALAEFVQAATLAPKDAEYLYDLGVLLAATGRVDSAVTVLLQASSTEPYYASPHFPLGILYEGSGFVEEAAHHFDSFIRLAPRTLGPAIAAAQRRLDALKAAPSAP